jgi:hypothetical protein
VVVPKRLISLAGYPMAGERGHGGKRRGAGRKPGSPSVVIDGVGYAELGPRPSDRRELAAWAMEVNAIALDEIRGQLARPAAATRRAKLRAELRAQTKTLLAAQPRSDLFTAEGTVRGAVAARKRPHADPKVGPRPMPEEPDGT